VALGSYRARPNSTEGYGVKARGNSLPKSVECGEDSLAGALGLGDPMAGARIVPMRARAGFLPPRRA
jgi:hypothetical protein